MSDAQSEIKDGKSGREDADRSEIEELRRRHERLNVLYQVTKVIHSTLDPQKALELIIGEAVRVTRASSGSVALVNPTTGFLEIQAGEGLPEQSLHLRLRVGEGITGWVARTGRPARVGDVVNDKRYIMVKENVRSELAVPFEVAGESRGVLNVDSDRPNAFSEEDEELLRDLSGHAAQVIHNTWLYEQIRQKARLFEALVSVSQTINSTLNLDEALSAIAREACTLIGGKMSSLLLLSEDGEWLEVRASHGAGEAYLKKPRVSLTESLVGMVVRRQKALQVENVQASGRYQNVEVAREEGLVSLVSVPLVYGGNAIGVLNVYTGFQYSFSNEEIRILSALAELSGIAIEKAKLYERIVDMEENLRQNEKLSAIGLLAAEVAHEIRNPLTVIKMLYHSLDLKFDTGDPRGRDAKVMRERIDHLNRIVEQVLDFGRTAEPVLAPVNVNQTIEDLALLIRHKLANQKIQFVRKLGSDLPKVQGDAMQLGQAFLNLALNAIEAMPQGGQLRIETSSVSEPDTGGQVIIQFEDTGVGMSEEQRAGAFKSLLQTTKKNGTGLGLAIVGKIVEAHSGKMELRSEQGKGSVFQITFPVATV